MNQLRTASPSDGPDTQRPAVRVTSADLKRLRTVAARHADGPHAEIAEQLETELERAKVSKLDPEHAFVTMGARVAVTSTQTGSEREFVLAWPEEADPAGGRISVLSPMGAAVLGLSVGDAIDWALPGGRTTRLRILRITPPDGAQQD